MGETTARPANAIDHKLLANAASMSPEELSALVGGAIRPDRVAAHVKKLLKARNWLDEAELDSLVTYKLQRILSEMEGRYMDVENATIQLKLLKEVGARLDRRKIATEVDLGVLYGNQARLMAQALTMAMERALSELQKKVPTLAQQDVRAALTEALPHAVLLISEHNRGDELE